MDYVSICSPNYLHFAHQRFKVLVKMPDQEVLSQDSAEKASSVAPNGKRRQTTRERLDAILGPYRGKHDAKAYTPDDYKAMWHEHLEEKYLDRR